MLRNYKKITDRVFHAVVVSRETMVDTPMDYASSGVDIDAEGAAVAVSPLHRAIGALMPHHLPLRPCCSRDARLRRTEKSIPFMAWFMAWRSSSCACPALLFGPHCLRA